MANSPERNPSRNAVKRGSDRDTALSAIHREAGIRQGLSPERVSCDERSEDTETDKRHSPERVSCDERSEDTETHKRLSPERDPSRSGDQTNKTIQNRNGVMSLFLAPAGAFLP